MALNGNIDCAAEDANTCSLPTAYGAATHNATVRLAGAENYLHVLSYLENRERFLPIPNSDTFMTFTAEPPFGVYLYFNYWFTASIKQIEVFGQYKYQITRPPDGVLQDQQGQRLASDINSVSFDQNGHWMVVSVPNVAMVRVNLQTFEVLPFASGFDYSLGLDPAPKTAITNDGRYAVVASKNFSRFKIYDLNSCGSVPATINGPVNCESRDLGSFMSVQFPSFSFVDEARFLNDNTLSIYANYDSGGASRAAWFLLGNNGLDAQIDYLALGDSYIVGEGAFDYQAGTDTDTNKCHLSFLAYPHLIGLDLNYNSYHSVACSGATTNDITNTDENYKGQADNKTLRRRDREKATVDSIFASFKPGYIDQMDFVSRYQPRAINLVVGGNDMGFSTILKACAIGPDSCYNTYEDRLELVRHINNYVYPKLIQTYSKLKSSGAPDMSFYVIGYPQIAKPGGNCGLNVRLSADELEFSRQLITYLDSVIQTAAQKSGIYYVDTQDALNGHRLCEVDPGSLAMNGLTAGNDSPARLGGPIGNESYHPNAFGYQLLENMILSETHDLTAPMPPANLAASLPPEDGLEILNAPKNNRPIKTAEYDQNISTDTAYPGSTLDIEIHSSDHALPPSAALLAELHSKALSLGSFTTDSTGNLITQVTLPPEISPGYHTLHFYGTDLAGQTIDIFKYIYIPGGTVSSSDETVQLDSETETPADLQSSNQYLASSNTKPDKEIFNGSGTVTKDVTGKILGAATALKPRGDFKPGWLLALLPTVLSIFYLFKKD